MQRVWRRFLPGKRGAVSLPAVRDGIVPNGDGLERVHGVPNRLGDEPDQRDGVHGLRCGQVAGIEWAGGVQDVRERQVPAARQHKRVPELRGGVCERAERGRLGRSRADSIMRAVRAGQVCWDNRDERVCGVRRGHLPECDGHDRVQGVHSKLLFECRPDGLFVVREGDVPGVGGSAACSAS
jgi:hypothetical protein